MNNIIKYVVNRDYDRDFLKNTDPLAREDA
jgi:hypothetical protein